MKINSLYGNHLKLHFIRTINKTGHNQESSLKKWFFWIYFAWDKSLQLSMDFCTDADLFWV